MSVSKGPTMFAATLAKSSCNPLLYSFLCQLRLAQDLFFFILFNAHWAGFKVDSSYLNWTSLFLALASKTYKPQHKHHHPGKANTDLKHRRVKKNPIQQTTTKNPTTNWIIIFTAAHQLQLHISDVNKLKPQQL